MSKLEVAMEDIINLDEAVINALNLFISSPPPEVNISTFSFPIVVGSGNAYNTGQIIFSSSKAIFADESNFKHTIESFQPLIATQAIDSALIISASGEKDAVWETELAKSYKLNTTLLTCNPESSAAQVADQVFAFQKVAEPYTYNTSTYMGMILSTTGESAAEIMSYLTKLKLPDNFSSHKSFSFILPDNYQPICPMLDIKKSELFGPHLSLRAFSQGHARHAKYVIPSEDELVISLDTDSQYYGHPQHRWQLTLPASASYATVLALTYYIIGKIQASQPPYFKDNIAKYVSDYGPKAYGKKQTFELIVPGNTDLVASSAG